MRRTVSILLCVLLFTLSAGCYADVPEHPIPILRYHDVVPDGAETGEDGVTAGRFREDVRWLQEHGYTFVLPSELNAGEIPARPAMLTFDDGLVSCYTVVFPILQELDAKAAVALIVSKVDQEDPDYLSWDMCREMSDSSLVEFGSHTYDLHNFDWRGGAYVEDTPNGIQRLEGEDVQDYANRIWVDLYKSAHTIQDQLGVEVCYFSYPFGVRDYWAQGYIRSHFPISVATGSGIASLDDFRDMDRLAITMDKTAGSYISR